MKHITLEMLTSFATKLAAKIETIFVKKESGKGLSSNDYTTTEKTKLAGIDAGANNYNHPNSGVTSGTYKSVTVNAQGHVTNGSNPTTLAGYGITDAAPKIHAHGDADITALDASKLTGTINIERLPQGALERLVKVADKVARFKLTTSQVQLGDTVQQLDTGVMYVVTDETNLNTEAGYVEYKAGSALSVPWSGIENIPTQFAPSPHTHNKSQITDFPTSMPASDVSAWAKATTKPSYTPAEIGVIGTAPTNGQVAVFDGTTGKIKSTGHTIGTSVPSGAKFTDTTYSPMTGATSSVSGTSGLIPAPSPGAANRYLRSDGTWAVPPDTDTVYTHPTTAGNKHIPSGGSSGQFLKWSSSGTAVWAADNNTTYSPFTGATSSGAGKPGLVPAPTSGATNKYLKSDGTWATIDNAESATDADIDNIINGLFS